MLAFRELLYTIWSFFASIKLECVTRDLSQLSQVIEDLQLGRSELNPQDQKRLIEGYEAYENRLKTKQDFLISCLVRRRRCLGLPMVEETEG